MKTSREQLRLNQIESDQLKKLRQHNQPSDMIKQKLINYDDLNGLNQLKLSKIKAMSMF